MFTDVERRQASAQHHDYWNGFYAGRASGDVPEEPSASLPGWRRSCPPGQEVVELGFGTARDSLFFSRQGRRVQGFDFAESAVEHARRQAAEQRCPRGSTTSICTTTRKSTASPRRCRSTRFGRAVYGRFLVHSLEEAGRANLLRLSASLLGDGGELFLEFRTGKDLGQEHLFGDDHFRVFLDPMVVELEIEALGGEVTYREEGCGLAVYKSEDPHVARMVAWFRRWMGDLGEQRRRGDRPRNPGPGRPPRGPRRSVRRRADLVVQPRARTHATQPRVGPLAEGLVPTWTAWPT